MPQLIPFHFLNETTFASFLLIFMIYVFSKYILPNFTRLFYTRSFLFTLDNPPKAHVFVSLPLQCGLFAKVLERFFSKKKVHFLISLLIFSFASRYLILEYLGVDVFADLFHTVSILYYSFIAVLSLTVREAIYIWLKE